MPSWHGAFQPFWALARSAHSSGAPREETSLPFVPPSSAKRVAQVAQALRRPECRFTRGVPRMSSFDHASIAGCTRETFAKRSPRKGTKCGKAGFVSPVTESPPSDGTTTKGPLSALSARKSMARAGSAEACIGARASHGVAACDVIGAMASPRVRSRSRSRGRGGIIRIRSPAPAGATSSLPTPWEGALWKGWIREAIVGEPRVRVPEVMGPRAFLTRTIDLEARRARAALPALAVSGAQVNSGAP